MYTVGVCPRVAAYSAHSALVIGAIGERPAMITDEQTPLSIRWAPVFVPYFTAVASGRSRSTLATHCAAELAYPSAVSVETEPRAPLVSGRIVQLSCRRHMQSRSPPQFGPSPLPGSRQ